MKNTIVIIAVCLLALISCEKDENTGILPSDIGNVRSDSLPGQIFLSWDMPADSSIYYVEVRYFDHRLKKEVVNLSSVDTLLIDQTRNKYGDYQFKLTPYSHTRTAGNSIEYKGVSGKAPIQETVVLEEELKFEADQITGNSLQDGGKNPPINLFDGDDKTIYHSRWQAPVPDIAWLSFDLKEEIEALKINWYPRTTHGEGKPVNVDLMGSLDGENWFLIVNLTKEKDDLPTGKTEWFKSPTYYKAPSSFRYLKYVVNETNTGTKFWHMSEMNLYKVELDIVDFEAPDTKE